MGAVNRAIVVFAHGKAAPAFQRHYPSWRKQTEHIFVVCPADDPLPNAWLAAGASQHSGAHAILRPKLALERALTLPFDEFIFIEYDCILLGKIPPVTPGFHASVFSDSMAEQNGFRSPCYFHSPWWCDRATLTTLQPYLSTESLERGYPDRWMAWVVLRAVNDGKVDLAIAPSYSRDSLDRPGWIEEARQARLAGKHFIHGVKTEAQLRGVMAAQPA